MKAILMSIQPKWCELIASGKKTVEVRKTAPKEAPFKVFIYQTKKRWIYKLLPFLEKWQTKVIGEFVCDGVTCIQAYYGNSGEKHLTNLFGIDIKNTCLSLHEIFDYIIGDKKDGTGWLYHITDLKIYDKPKELGEFKTIKCTNKRGSCSDCKTKPDCIKQITRPPQGWQYVEEIEE